MATSYTSPDPAALAASLPVGMGALVGQPGGSPLGLVNADTPAPVHGGALLDARLMDLDRRVSVLEQGEAGGAAL